MVNNVSMKRDQVVIVTQLKLLKSTVKLVEKGISPRS